MKLAYMYATPDVTHSNVTAIQGDPAEVLRFLRKTGYSGVEFLVRDAAQIDQQTLVRIAADEGLDTPAICTGEVYGEDGLSFADPDATRRGVAIDRMMSAMEMGARFGAMVNVGRLRGRFTDGVAPEQTLDWIASALCSCADAFPEVRIVLEPVNHLYANCLLGTEESLAFVRRTGRKNIGLMLDIVHMLTENEDPARSMALTGDLFWHYHISDSDRLPVGAGTYDIDTIMTGVLKSGFDAYVTAEHFQKPSGLSSAEQSYQRLAGFFSSQRVE